MCDTGAMPARACTFCSITQGHTPAHAVAADAGLLAFLDHRPLFPGHVLLVPRAHIETLPDVPPDLLGPMFTLAQRLCTAVQSAMGAEGTFVAINNRVSQSVPHLHVHAVPRRRKDGLRGFFWPRTRYADGDEMAETAARIRAALT